MEITKEATVIGALNDFMRDWETRELDDIMSHFAPSATVSLYGTGADEKRVGRDEILVQLRRDFAQSESLRCDLNWNLVGVGGSVAWVASDVTIHYKVAGYDEVSFPGRVTSVMQDYDGRWLMEHFHLSVAAGNQEEGQSF